MDDRRFLVIKDASTAIAMNSRALAPGGMDRNVKLTRQASKATSRLADELRVAAPGVRLTVNFEGSFRAWWSLMA